MVSIFLKVIYVFLIVGINLYVGSYFVNKIAGRTVYKRGYTAIKDGGVSYPAFKIFKYLEKDSKVGLWDFLLLLFSFFIWVFIPFSNVLILIRFDNDLIISLLFLMILFFLFVINNSKSKYSLIFNNISRNVVMMFSFLIPLFLNIASLVLINRTLALKEIIGLQYRNWNIIYQPLGFLIFLCIIFLQVKIFGLTKTDKLFYGDNWGIEGNGFAKLALRIANYNIVFFLIVLTVILYLAGWQNFYFINGNIMFLLKFYIIFFIILLIDKATPAINYYKYLTAINLKFLTPISVVNFIITIVFFMLRNVYSLI